MLISFLFHWLNYYSLSHPKAAPDTCHTPCKSPCPWTCLYYILAEGRHIWPRLLWSYQIHVPMLRSFRPKRDICQFRIIGFWRMFHKQLIRWIQTFRHLHIIPDIDLIFIHTVLNWITSTIILMDDGIQQNLPKNILMKHKLFHPLDSLIGNQRFHVFRIYQSNRLVHLFAQRAMHFILIP